MDGGNDTRAQSDEWIERLAILLDRAIPLGQRFGIGLDAILGLIPGVGDLAGGVLSAIIIVQAHRVGVPKPTLLRMVANVGIDSVLGSIPVLGDMFDVAFQSNLRNVELYRQAMRGQRDSRRDAGFLVVLLLALGLLAAIPIFVIFWLIQRVGLF